MTLPANWKAYAWGAVGGAIALSMVMFSWDFWLTAGQAEKLAKQRSDAAVALALAPLCVDKFMQAKDAPARLAELKKADQYQQASLVEKGGWAVRPGTQVSDAAIAKHCADILAKSEPPKTPAPPAKR